MHSLNHAAFILLASVIGLAGCSGVAPTPPPQWSSEVVTSSRALHGDRAELQVIITYDRTYSTHTAMRLTTAGDGALFWDPAGRYGETSDGQYDARVKRVNDLIVGNEPTIETYWTSSVNASDTAMEVFEWDLLDHQARQMRTALLRGAGLEASRNDFRTKTIKPFCAIAVSQFFLTSEDAPVSLEHSYFLPHNLAEALYRSNPDRVIVYRRGRKTMVYSNPQSLASHRR